MRLRHTILWKVDVDYATSLQEKLPDQRIRNPFVKVADVNSRILVLFPV